MNAIREQIAGVLKTALLAATVLNARADIERGATRDQVTEELGYAESLIRIGNTEVLTYKNGTCVRLEGGLVSEMSHRGQCTVTRIVVHKSPIVLFLDQNQSRNDEDVQDRSEFHQTVRQGGKTLVRTVRDEERGQVFQFDGQDAYLRVAQTAELDLEQGLTLCAWVKPNSLNQQSPVLEWEKNGTHLWVNAKGAQWQTKPTGVNWCIQGEGAQNVVSTTNPPTAQWTHLAVTYDPAKHRSAVFVNGERATETGVPSGTPRTQGDLIIGARPSITRDARFNGLMDDLLIVRRALGQDEIRQIMGTESQRLAKSAPPNPVVEKAASPTAGKPTPAKAINEGAAGAVAADNPVISPRAKALLTVDGLSTLLTRIQQAVSGLSRLLTVVALGGYVFGCYCFKRICEKAGEAPGAMVWLPVVQCFPLLRVAELPAWMFILLLIPLVNIVVTLFVWARICAVLDKNPWLAASLLVPVVNLLLIPYLAFSGTDQAEG